MNIIGILIHLIIIGFFSGIRFYPESNLRKKYYVIVEQNTKNTNIMPFKWLAQHQLGKYNQLHY